MYALIQANKLDTCKHTAMEFNKKMAGDCIL